MNLLNRAKKEWRHLRNNGEFLLLALPAFVFMLVFNYLPMSGIVIAFKRYRHDLGIFGSEWVGLKNFEFFFQSATSWNVTRNTVLYNLVFLVLTTMTALLFAILLNELTRKWVKIHQTILFLPYFLSWVVVSYIVLSFLDYRNGYFNSLLTQAGKEPVQWYFSPQYWPYLLVLIHLWKSVGFSTLVYYAGIMNIDTALYEAAMIDGASTRQMIRYITLPLLLPLVTILALLALGGIFRGDFGLFFFVPNNSSFLYRSTDVIDTYVYRSLAELGNLGMGAAVGLYQSLVGFVTILVANRLVRRISKENALW